MARVLDFTSDVGAYGTRLLAELGHDVVRIEPPGGDALRREANGMFHEFLNAGKRSVVLDRQGREDRETLLGLIGNADAVVTSLPLPLPEAVIMGANPQLVLVQLDDGPPELCAFARSGLLAITGEPDGRPTLLGGHIPHSAVGLYVAMAAASALFAKAATGNGCIVDVSAAQCLAVLAEQVFVEYSSSGELLERLGSRGGITALAGALPCADGHWMVSVPPDPNGWANFVQVVPDPAFKDDDSLADEAERRERKHEILDRIALWSTHQQKDEIVAEAQRRHIPAAPVLNPLDLTRDPQLIARGFLREVEHPEFGHIHFPAGALANLWHETLAPASQLGAANATILRDLSSPDGRGEPV
jgi:CoA:oxalate CoA-transferase